MTNAHISTGCEGHGTEQSQTADAVPGMNKNPPKEE